MHINEHSHYWRNRFHRIRELLDTYTAEERNDTRIYAWDQIVSQTRALMQYRATKVRIASSRHDWTCVSALCLLRGRESYLKELRELHPLMF